MCRWPLVQNGWFISIQLGWCTSWPGYCIFARLYCAGFNIRSMNAITAGTVGLLVCLYYLNVPIKSTMWYKNHIVESKNGDVKKHMGKCGDSGTRYVGHEKFEMIVDDHRRQNKTTVCTEKQCEILSGHRKLLVGHVIIMVPFPGSWAYPSVKILIAWTHHNPCS